jgi:broad specificity phosphatase PhoE
MPAAPPAPAALWFVRHGESAANVARNAAYAAAVEEVDVAERDQDVPLSPLGERQADALGRWFAAQPDGERPTVVLASPYERAHRTAARVVAAGALAGGDPDPARVALDERWREKELGLFFRVTHHGVSRRYPEQWALRQEQDVFYYRPPNGESGADVALRVRAALGDLARDYAGERVLVVCHQVTILCARYVLERMTEAQVLAAWRAYDLANCSVTEYRPAADDGAGDGAGDGARPGAPRLALARLNHTVPVEAGGPAADDGAPATAEPSAASTPER